MMIVWKGHEVIRKETKRFFFDPGNDNQLNLEGFPLQGFVFSVVFRLYQRSFRSKDQNLLRYTYAIIS